MSGRADGIKIRKNTVSITFGVLVFVGVFVAALLGVLDGPLNGLFDAFYREETNRFERAYFHLVGPQDVMREVRQDHFREFAQFAACVAMVVASIAFLAARLVLNLAADIDTEMGKQRLTTTDAPAE